MRKFYTALSLSLLLLFSLTLTTNLTQLQAQEDKPAQKKASEERATLLARYRDIRQFYATGGRLSHADWCKLTPYEQDLHNKYAPIQRVLAQNNVKSFAEIRLFDISMATAAGTKILAADNEVVQAVVISHVSGAPVEIEYGGTSLGKIQAGMFYCVVLSENADALHVKVAKGKKPAEIIVERLNSNFVYRNFR